MLLLFQPVALSVTMRVRNRTAMRPPLRVCGKQGEVHALRQRVLELESQLVETEMFMQSEPGEVIVTLEVTRPSPSHPPCLRGSMHLLRLGCVLKECASLAEGLGPDAVETR
jgi:hypothetical protein